MSRKGLPVVVDRPDPGRYTDHMAKNTTTKTTHQITLPDGHVMTRKSDNVYTHATIARQSIALLVDMDKRTIKATTHWLTTETDPTKIAEYTARIEEARTRLENMDYAPHWVCLGWTSARKYAETKANKYRKSDAYDIVEVVEVTI